LSNRFFGGGIFVGGCSLACFFGRPLRRLRRFGCDGAPSLEGGVGSDFWELPCSETFSVAARASL
jgi:hypothetical protein